MRLLPLVFSVFLFGCVSADSDQLKGKPKEDPYAESTLSTIKANQDIYVDQRKIKWKY